MPLPFVPGDALLIAAGLLIANGSLSPWIFLPCAFMATLGGALTAYTWARLLGARGLAAFAERIHASGPLERASARLRYAGPVRIAMCRLLPGLRVYTTMVAGAVEVDTRIFVLGTIPAIAIWLTVFTLLGVLVGVPAEHLLTRVQRVAAEGVVLIAIGVVAYLGLRHIPPTQRGATPLQSAPRPWRLALSLLIDIGIVASVVSGVVEIVGDAVGWPDPDGVIDLAVIFVASALCYVTVTRRGIGATAGETFLNVSYVSHPRS